MKTSISGVFIIQTNEIKMKSIQTQLFGVILSVDSNEWYYGRPENRLNFEKRVLIDNIVSEDNIVSAAHAKEINDYFKWVEFHEKDTVKRKRRPLYVDKGFFIDSGK